MKRIFIVVFATVVLVFSGLKIADFFYGYEYQQEKDFKNNYRRPYRDWETVSCTLTEHYYSSYNHSKKTILQNFKFVDQPGTQSVDVVNLKTGVVKGSGNELQYEIKQKGTASMNTVLFKSSPTQSMIVISNFDDNTPMLYNLYSAIGTYHGVCHGVD